MHRVLTVIISKKEGRDMKKICSWLLVLAMLVTWSLPGRWLLG